MVEIVASFMLEEAEEGMPEWMKVADELFR